MCVCVYCGNLSKHLYKISRFIRSPEGRTDLCRARLINSQVMMMNLEGSRSRPGDTAKTVTSTATARSSSPLHVRAALSLTFVQNVPLECAARAEYFSTVQGPLSLLLSMASETFVKRPLTNFKVRSVDQSRIFLRASRLSSSTRVPGAY